MAEQFVKSACPLLFMVALCKISSELSGQLMLVHELIGADSRLAERLCSHFMQESNNLTRVDICALSYWMELLDTDEILLEKSADSRLEWLERVNAVRAAAEQILYQQTAVSDWNSDWNSVWLRWNRICCVALFVQEVSCPYDRENNSSAVQPLSLWQVSHSRLTQQTGWVQMLVG